jgi:hypothetical protein
MTRKTDAALLIQATQIKTETTAGANSATRIGQLQEDLVQSKSNITEIGDRHGWVNPPNADNFTISNIGSSVTVNVLIGAGDYKINGALFANTGALTITFTASLGQNFVCLNSSGLNISAFDIMDLTKILVATVNWDGTTVVLADELHLASRNLTVHLGEHETDGARYVSGFATTYGSSANNTFASAAGVIRDEERHHSIGARTQGTILYRNAAQTAMITDAASTRFTKLVSVTTGSPYYDNAGVLTILGTNNYGVMWMYATNRKLPTNNEMIFVMGQGTYNNVAAAQAAVLPTIVGMSIAEWKLLDRVIIRQVGGALVFIQADDLRLTTTGLAVNGGVLSTIAATNVTRIPTSTLTSTNAEAGLNELDTKIIAAPSKWSSNFLFRWNTITTNITMGIGYIHGNNATLASITTFYVSDEERKNGTPSEGNMIAIMADSVGSKVKLQCATDRTKWVIFEVTTYEHHAEENYCWVGVTVLSFGSVAFALDDVVGMELVGGGGSDFTVDEIAAITGAATPSALNVFATMADIGEVNGISSFTLNADNSYVDVVFSSKIYGDSVASTQTFYDYFSIVFNANGGTALGVSIHEITRTDNKFLRGGESIIRFHLYVDGICSGVESIVIAPIASKIYNLQGVVYLDTVNTGSIVLNSENVDYLTRFKDLTCYVDAVDLIYSTVSKLTDKSNSEIKFNQSVVANQATKQSDGLLFVAGDHMIADRPVWLNKTGFSIFICLTRTVNSDDIILSTDTINSITQWSSLSYMMIRTTTVNFATHGGSGGVFSYAVGTDKTILEFRYTGVGTNCELYANNVLAASVAFGAIPLYFTTIGLNNASQAFDGVLHALCVFNSTDATRRAAVYNRMVSKYMTATTPTNTFRPLFLPYVFGFEVEGQSNAGGRYATSTISTKYNKFTGSIPGAFIFPNADTDIILKTPYSPDDPHSGENSANHFGIENSILRLLRDNYGRGYVFKFAKGGTSLGTTARSDDWAKSLNETYKECYYFQHGGIQLMRGKLVNLIVLIQIWLQGEEDAVDLTNSAAYQVNFTARISDYKADSFQPMLQFLFYKLRSSAYKDTVNSGVIAMADIDTNLKYSSFTDGMTLVDGVHYSADSLILMGVDTFEYYLKNLINYQLALQ